MNPKIKPWQTGNMIEMILYPFYNRDEISIWAILFKCERHIEIKYQHSSFWFGSPMMTPVLAASYIFRRWDSDTQI